MIVSRIRVCFRVFYEPVASLGSNHRDQVQYALDYERHSRQMRQPFRHLPPHLLPSFTPFHPSSALFLLFSLDILPLLRISRSVQSGKTVQRLWKFW